MRLQKVKRVSYSNIRIHHDFAFFFLQMQAACKIWDLFLYCCLDFWRLQLAILHYMLCLNLLFSGLVFVLFFNNNVISNK